MGMFDDLIPAGKSPSGMFDDLIPKAAPNAGRSRFDEVGAGEAALRGAGQGLTFNFGDELTGARAASGITSGNPLAQAVAPIVGAGRLGYEALAGEGDATKRYQEAVERERELTRAAKEQQPGAYTAGEIGGAVAIPAGGLLRAPTLFGRALRGAGVGAGFGALSGAGEGETLPDRAVKGATGGAVGAGVGAIAPPLVEGAVKLGSVAISKPANFMRSVINPQGTADRAVGRAFIESARADPQAVNRLTAADLGQGGPGVVMDVLGEPGRRLAKSASNISGEARHVLDDTLNPRFEEQVPRLAGWLRSTFHYPDVHAQEEAIKATAKTVNNPNYARARRDGIGGIWDQELAEISQAPPVQDAVKAAIKQTQTKSAPDVSQGLAAVTARWHSPKGGPTLEFWDLVKRQLDQEINVAKRAGRNEDVADLTSVKNTIVGKLDAAVPSYAMARQGAAYFFGAENALEAGQKYVTETFANPGTRRALAEMSPTERQLFQDGFVSRYIEVLSKIPDRANMVRRIHNNPADREKFTIVLGPQRANELEAMLRVENIMQQGLQAVQGNSTTAAQLLGAGLAGATGGGFLGFDPTASGVALAFATAGKKGIDQRVANRVAELLTSNDPAVLRRGAQMFASNKRLMDVLRSLDSGAAKVGGQQARLPAITAQSANRAEDDDPTVPRPVGQ